MPTAYVHSDHCRADVCFIYSPHVCLQSQRLIVDYFGSCEANPDNTRLSLFRSTCKGCTCTHNRFHLLRLIYISLLGTFIFTCYLILLDSYTFFFFSWSLEGFFSFKKSLFFKIAQSVIISLLSLSQMCKCWTFESLNIFFLKMNTADVIGLPNT